MMMIAATCLAGRGLAAAEADCSRNAALGYWMAMAQMQNPDADAALAETLERTARGQVPWDDRLAPVVEANREALATMHRAARQPFCDWGLEYSRDAEAPIAHLVRARTLARLNVLLGMSLLEKSKAEEAAEVWLDGLRFSRDIASGAPLLGALFAFSELETHMRAIERAVGRGLLPDPQVRAIERFVSALPEDGFDWGTAVDVELGGIVGLQQRLLESDDARPLLRRTVAGEGSGVEQDVAVAAYLGIPVGSLGDGRVVRRALERGLAAMTALRPRAVAALRLPYAESIPVMAEILAEARKDPTLAAGWPSLARANEEARGRLVKARAALLTALRASR
jgi:hypothetical protein